MNKICKRLAFLGLFFLFSFALYPTSTLGQQKQFSADEWKEFLSFENQDLLKLDKQHKERFGDLLWRVLPHTDGFTWFDNPYCLARITTQENLVRLVLVEGSTAIRIPGISKARIGIFDTEGRLLNSVELQTGWRILTTGAKILQKSPLDVPLIEVSTKNVINGRDVARELYGLIGVGVGLVRLEDSKGHILRNQYVATNWTIGPNLPTLHPKDWENSLMSDNPVDVLSTLVWLGGIHWDLKISRTWPDGRRDPSPEIKKHAIDVNQVRGLEAVQNKLKELTKSKNQWIKQAAELAIRPEDGDTSFHPK